MSKGEEKILSILRTAKLSVIKEKTFPDLKQGKFRFDFYIPNLHGRDCIVEFNGEQHYHYVKKFYKNQQEWHKAQEHDRRKISFCLAKNIPIYIIPFWEIDNIKTAEDLFQEKFRARTRWKNDEELYNSPLYKKI